MRDREIVVADPAAMQEFGVAFAQELHAGDLVILSGPLGAGKTTLVQGLARGLHVRGAVTSPTFVIARVHRSLVGGADLVHADAYRLGSLAEVDDLDLDASIDDSVTVVEWGEGKVEGLTDRHITVRITRDADAGEVRRVTVQRDTSLPGGGNR
jgi:tRNA threonylcarbamoyladenosine biosynthesis protein TsaE